MNALGGTRAGKDLDWNSQSPNQTMPTKMMSFFSFVNQSFFKELTPSPFLQSNLSTLLQISCHRISRQTALQMVRTDKNNIWETWDFWKEIIYPEDHLVLLELEQRFDFFCVKVFFLVSNEKPLLTDLWIPCQL